ncbi:hypothetical protein H0H87_002525 [Tephrocybe sp. NHM501043]|nr:hypothetical protein H0H87_002525 [Tephrocybe sp. NHM501043]
MAPARVSQQLMKDQQQLSQQLTIITFYFSSSLFIRGHFQLPPNTKDDVAFRVIRNPDVFEFWRDYIGQKILYARGDRFLEALKFRFGNWLNDATRRHFFMCLDEFRTGGVSPSTLERFVGEVSLKQSLERFLASASRTVHHHVDRRLPLLIWIDDRPENNAEEVGFAVESGVHVHQFTSTALVKAWIEDNEDFLRENDSADKIRFISDTARFENSDHLDAQDNSYLNLTAGENIARYLRGHLYQAPLLIYCGAGIVHTHYVKSYEATGSTCRSAIARAYITALSKRTVKDEFWKGFDVTTIEP